MAPVKGLRGEAADRILPAPVWRMQPIAALQFLV
jgi:hypothetical protein